MTQDVQNIQNMMRELVVLAVDKFNKRVMDNNVYNEGIAHAYGSTLSLLYDQVKLFHIPLNYLSLHTMNPEKASFSNEMVYFDKNMQIPKVQEEYQSRILDWLSDNKWLIKERYEDHLPDSVKDEFYKAAVEGYREIFTLMEKYGIKCIN